MQKQRLNVVLGLIFSGFVGLSGAAFADICAYEQFTPKNMKLEILSNLSYVGESFFSSVAMNENNNTVYILRDTELLGTMEVTDDALSRESSLIVKNNDGQELLKIEESNYRCGQARCRTTSFGTAADLLDGDSPYQVVFRSPGGIDQYAYGRRVSPDYYSLKIRSELEWMARYFRDTHSGQQLQFESPLQQFRFSLASDALVRPFYPYLTISQVSGATVVSGVVSSNAVYSAIVEHALRLGLNRIDPQLIIDTGYFPEDGVRATPGECW